MATPESKVKTHVKAWLTRRNIWWFCPVQMGLGVNGTPDFLCCRPVTITQDMVGQTLGVFLAIETKAPGKRANLSANQERQISLIHKASGSAVVIDDVEQLTLLENVDA